MNRFKPALRLGGALLALGAGGWVLYRIAGSRFWALPPEALGPLLERTLIAAPLYAAGCVLLAGPWWLLLRHRGTALAAFPVALAVYARTQLAKYLPGNVLHLVGRHALASGMGLPHRALAGALMFEIGGLCLVAAVLAAILGTPFALPAAAAWLGPGALIGLGAAGLALLLLGHRWAFRPAALGPGARLPSLVLGLLGYGGFFAVLGGITALLFGGLTATGPGLPWAPLFGLAALAWLGGFATPGAPAGLGVRDAILLAGLHGLAPEAEAAGVVVALRLVTLGGDLLFGLAGLVLPLPSPALGPESEKHRNATK